MRIVQVCPYDPDRHGGVQRHMHALAGALAARGHATLIIAPGAGKPSDGGLWRLGGMRSVAFGGTRFEVTWASGAELARVAAELRRWRPDVVHFHTPWDPLMPWQLFRRVGVARVATFHDTPPPGATGAALRSLFKLLSRYLLARLDGAIAVSEAPLAHLRPGASGVTPVVLPPVTGLSPFFALDKAPQGERADVLFLGRLEPRKGVEVLLEAVSRIAGGQAPLPPGLPRPRFVVAGDGDLRGAVLAMQERLGQGWIDVIPSPSQTAQLALLRGARLAVSPALYGESFGIVLAEALASGTPAIGADNAGYRTVLTGRGAALLTPAGDAAALAEKIIELLAHPELRAELADWGRSHARQFDVTARIGDFEAFYRDAVARHATRHPRSKAEG
ncbi:MAG: glycosyltransferase family 4 protein [Aestuariivirga sp.]|uniref:glycosyltransferase family 4 protein n=1 Tax=Aestuariivirga sp. TaxID=2650926 RepID=UPI0025C0E72A|nr:glycosyltransferase family 4 protein [Aestuariivirga sp.]MCA3561688.1 glycosyltransferase family 4 protein [Aestuariivirga sp.]